MKKTLTIIALLLAVLLVISSCGATSSDLALYKTKQNGMAIYDYADAEESTLQDAGGSFGFTFDDMDYVVESESKVYNSNTANGNELTSVFEQRKIIYSSNFRIQTTEFDTAVSELDALCEKYGAYYESSNQYGTAERANRHSSYTVRVPVQNYKAFRTETGDIGVVVQSSENNRDVTENYFDTEARLASAKLREERLLEILKTADTLDNILLLEAELADVRYEIESFTGTLRKYDSLISYSTISIDIEEVIKPVEIKTAPRTFGQRISQATSTGFSDFSDGLQDIAVYISYNLPSIVIFIIFIVVVIIVLKTAISKSKNKRVARVEETNTEESK